MANIIRADLDEMVFRFRNREYGAYVLRKLNVKDTVRAFIIATAAIALIGFLPVIISALSPEEAMAEQQAVEVQLETPPPIDEEEAPPPPPEVEPPPPPKQIQFVPPNIVETEEADVEVEIIRADTVQVQIGQMTSEGPESDAILDLSAISPGGTGTPELQVPVQQDLDPNAFVAVDEQPQPVNMADIKSAIQYPQIARDNGISGKVIMRVYIDEQGKYIKHIVLKTPHPWLTEAVVPHLPKLRFTPAIQAGRPIKLWVNVPFDFNLQR